MVPNSFTRTADHSKDVYYFCSVSFFVLSVRVLFRCVVSCHSNRTLNNDLI